MTAVGIPSWLYEAFFLLIQTVERRPAAIGRLAMWQDHRVRSSFLSSLPALTGRWFDTRIVTELSPKHLYFGHLMTGGALPLRDRPSSHSRNRESGYPTRRVRHE